MTTTPVNDKQIMWAARSMMLYPYKYAGILPNMIGSEYKEGDLVDDELVLINIDPTGELLQSVMEQQNLPLLMTMIKDALAKDTGGNGILVVSDEMENEHLPKGFIRLKDSPVAIPIWTQSPKYEMISYEGRMHWAAQFWEQVRSIFTSLPNFDEVIDYMDGNKAALQTMIESDQAAEIVKDEKNKLELSTWTSGRIASVTKLSDDNVLVQMNFGSSGSITAAGDVLDTCYANTYLFDDAEHVDPDPFTRSGILKAVDVYGESVDLRNFKPSVFGTLNHSRRSSVSRTQYDSVWSGTKYLISTPPAVQDEVITISEAVIPHTAEQVVLDRYHDKVVHVDDITYQKLKNSVPEGVQLTILPVDLFGAPILPLGSTATLYKPDGSAIEITTVNRLAEL